jgi:hypothetical protein
LPLKPSVTTEGLIVIVTFGRVGLFPPPHATRRLPTNKQIRARSTRRKRKPAVRNATGPKGFGGSLGMGAIRTDDSCLAPFQKTGTSNFEKGTSLESWKFMVIAVKNRKGL